MSTNKREETSVQYYDRLIKETDDDGVRENATAQRDMLLFDVSLNTISSKIGLSTTELIQLEKNPSENPKEIQELRARIDKSLDIRDKIYSGDQTTMYNVIHESSL